MNKLSFKENLTEHVQITWINDLGAGSRENLKPGFKYNGHFIQKLYLKSVQMKSSATQVFKHKVVRSVAVTARENSLIHI